MTTFDFERIARSKAAHRQALAALPVAEKLRLLDALRERALALRPAKPARGPAGRVADPASEFRTSAD